MVENKKIMNKKTIGLILGVIILASMFIIPATEELPKTAIRFLTIFLAITVFMVFDTMNQVVALLFALVAFTLTGVAEGTTAFASFGSSTVWLLVGVFGLASAVTKTGVLKRLALGIMSLFPENYTGSITAITVVSVILSPTMPSAAAKMSIVGPLGASLCEILGFEKGSKQAAGMFTAGFVPAHFTSNIFLSGALIYTLCAGYLGKEYTFVNWLTMTCIWGVVLFVLTWLFCIFYYKPEKKQVEKVKEGGYCKTQLKAMGKMSGDEIYALIILVIVLALFITSSITKIPNYVVALGGLLAFCFKGIFTPAEFVTKLNWPVIISVGAISSIATFLSTTGTAGWIGTVLSPIFGSLASNVWILVPTICIIGFLLRYIIVSTTALVAILYAVFGTLAAAQGIDPFVVIFTSYMTALLWPLEFGSSAYMSCAGTMPLVTFKAQIPSSYAIAVINLIGCMASIPLWKILGLC